MNEDSLGKSNIFLIQNVFIGLYEDSKRENQTLLSILLKMKNTIKTAFFMQCLAFAFWKGCTRSLKTIKELLTSRLTRLNIQPRTGQQVLQYNKR